ncbi:hypothetical protein KY308_01145 [Candidatus Woesearchaeota archaeon]|nr:hypothetical protein [Candidatus Woesearchaeota archaeon]
MAVQLEDISQFAEACKKVAGHIKNQNPSIKICAVPQAYIVGKILERMGIEGIMPAECYNEESKGYQQVEQILRDRKTDELSISVIALGQENPSKCIDMFTTALSNDLLERNWKGYTLNLQVLNIVKDVRDSSDENILKLMGTNALDKNVFVNIHSASKNFGVPNIFSKSEIMGLDYVKGVLTRVKNFGEVTVYEKERKIYGTNGEVHRCFTDVILKS